MMYAALQWLCLSLAWLTANRGGVLIQWLKHNERGQRGGKKWGQGLPKWKMLVFPTTHC